MEVKTIHIHVQKKIVRKACLHEHAFNAAVIKGKTVSVEF